MFENFYFFFVVNEFDDKVESQMYCFFEIKQIDNFERFRIWICRKGRSMKEKKNLYFLFVNKDNQ